MSCYVIGDIHGCLSELACLVSHLPLEDEDRVVFLGDYIDRGPDSKGVISYLLDAEGRLPGTFVFLKGNHEDMFLSFLGLPGHYGEMFLANGGKSTVASYGVSTDRRSLKTLLLHLPAAHKQFLLDLRTHYVHDSFLCVHAGVQPGRPLDEQSDLDMFWIRNDFISTPHGLTQTVVFGHTPQKDVLVDLPSKIGIDTGVVYGNKLTCIELDEKKIYQVRRGSRRVTEALIKVRGKPHAQPPAT